MQWWLGAHMLAYSHTQKQVSITFWPSRGGNYHPGFTLYFQCRDLCGLQSIDVDWQSHSWNSTMTQQVISSRCQSGKQKTLLLVVIHPVRYHLKILNDEHWLTMCHTQLYIVLMIFSILPHQLIEISEWGLRSPQNSYIEKCSTWYNLDRGLKITHLLMNSEHTSFPPFDFLQPGSLKFIRLFKLISSVANSFWLIVHNDEDDN